MCLENVGTPSVTIGDTNSEYIKKHAAGGIHTTTTIPGQEYLWATQFTNFKLNGTSGISSLASSGGKAIFDTGSFAIQLEASVYSAFTENIKALNIAGMDCDNYPQCQYSS